MGPQVKAPINYCIINSTYQLVVSITDNKLSLGHFEKPDDEKISLDYKHSVAPLSFKNSVLYGAIHRARNACCSEFEFKKAFTNAREKFRANNFPRKVIDEKIADLVSRNFEQSEYRRLQNEKQKKLDNTNSCILTLPYTSFKCSKIAKQIIRTVKKFLPEYDIRIVFSTIRLNFSILPTIKPTKPTLETTNSIYSFLCPCDSEYIGESNKSLKSRISEHKTPSRKSSAQDHISICQEYKSSLRKFKRDFARENIRCSSNEIEKNFLTATF